MSNEKKEGTFWSTVGKLGVGAVIGLLAGNKKARDTVGNGVKSAATTVSTGVQKLNEKRKASKES